jgi:hypothetical protein
VVNGNIQGQAYERLAWEPGVIPFRFNCGPIRGSGHGQAVTWGRERLHAGVSDLAALCYGRFMIWIEIKQPGEKHLDSQVAFAAEVEAAGGLVFTVRTMAELEQVIERVRNFADET